MSIEIQLSSVYTRYADNKTKVKVKGSTISECINDLVRQYPKLAKILLDRDGKLLNSCDVYLNGEGTYPDGMTKPVKDGDKLNIVAIILGG